VPWHVQPPEILPARVINWADNSVSNPQARDSTECYFNASSCQSIKKYYVSHHCKASFVPIVPEMLQITI